MVRAAIAYAARRLNNTTFLLIQNDRFTEKPFIYVKLYTIPALAVIIDTGCGFDNATDPSARFPDLRQFIEECPVADNDDKPLNAVGEDGPLRGRKREYMIICTHCHYDHICGITSFVPQPAELAARWDTSVEQETTVIASSFSKSFLSPGNLPHSSLCEETGLATPKYEITFAADGEWLEHDGKQLRLRVLHTPGHTPDSLAVYDEAEHWLFTGDSFYLRKCILPDGEDFRQPIIFDEAGNWTLFEQSCKKLLKFVEGMENTSKVLRSGEREDHRVRIGCGHTTDAEPAEQLLQDVLRYFRRVAVTFEVPILKRSVRRGVKWALWQEEGDPQFSILAPERLRMEYGG